MTMPLVQIDQTMFTDLSSDSRIEITLQPDGAGRLAFSNLHSNAANDTELGTTPKTISDQMK